MSAVPYKISERVFERIAQLAALSVPGSVKQDAKLAGLAGKSLPNFVATLDRQGGVAHFDAELAIAFPSPAKAVVQEVRETIAQRIADMTGFRVSRINVTIASFVADDSGFKVTRDIVANHRREAPVRAIHVPPSRVASPSVRPRRDLSSISVAPSRDVTHISAPRPREIVSAGFLDGVQEVQLCAVPRPEPLRVSTTLPPAPKDLVPVSTPQPAELTPITVQPLPEVDITVVPFNPPEVKEPAVITPAELTPITTTPMGGSR